MATYKLDLPHAPMMSLDGSHRDAVLPAALRDLAAEVVQVLKGGVMPIAAPLQDLRQPLRRDLGLD